MVREDGEGGWRRRRRKRRRRRRRRRSRSSKRMFKWIKICDPQKIRLAISQNRSSVHK
jgi:hypothetical protein